MAAPPPLRPQRARPRPRTRPGPAARGERSMRVPSTGPAAPVRPLRDHRAPSAAARARPVGVVGTGRVVSGVPRASVVEEAVKASRRAARPPSWWAHHLAVLVPLVGPGPLSGMAMATWSKPPGQHERAAGQRVSASCSLPCPAVSVSRVDAAAAGS